MSRTGWTVGTGVEWAFSILTGFGNRRRLTNYYDFGSSGALLTSPAGGVSVNSLKDTIHAVTAGVNYRF